MVVVSLTPELSAKGFPTEIDYDGAAQIADDEIFIASATFTRFSRLPPCVSARGDVAVPIIVERSGHSNAAAAANRIAR
jgi:hypothetical protein